MRNSQKATFAQVFEVYISAVTARGVKDKTIATYKQHFHAISKRLDVSLPINRLNSTVLDNMILQMRKEGLSDSSINSYTRTLKCFLSWCNEEGYQLARKMGLKRVLVLTFKPAVESAWREDLVSHVDFEGWQFVSNKDAHNNNVNIDQQFAMADKSKPIVVFGSFQDLLGTNDAGGIKAKNEFIHDILMSS